MAQAPHGAALLKVLHRSDHWVVIGGPVPPGYAAITLGPVVSVRARHAGDERLLRHEAVHVQQWRRLGAVRFVRRYVSSYLRLRLAGWPNAAAYRRIPLEVEAGWLAR